MLITYIQRYGHEYHVAIKSSFMVNKEPVPLHFMGGKVRNFVN